MPGHPRSLSKVVDMAEQSRITLSPPARLHRWMEVPLPAGVTQEQIRKALTFCSAKSRFYMKDDGTVSLEVAAEDEVTAAIHLQRISQAIADQKLRDEINLKANPDITALVDGIIRRAWGG